MLTMSAVVLHVYSNTISCSLYHYGKYVIDNHVPKHTLPMDGRAFWSRYDPCVIKIRLKKKKKDHDLMKGTMPSMGEKGVIIWGSGSRFLIIIMKIKKIKNKNKGKRTSFPQVHCLIKS